MPDAPTGTTPLRVMSTLAVMGVLQELLPAREKATGGADHRRLRPDRHACWAGSRRARPADLAILTAEAIDGADRRRHLAGRHRVDMAVSVVGVAVRAGRRGRRSARPRPSASAAGGETIAYSRAGASGIFFAGLIERLGIAAEVNAKATVIPQGFTADWRRAARWSWRSSR